MGAWDVRCAPGVGVTTLLRLTAVGLTLACARAKVPLPGSGRMLTPSPPSSG